MFGAKGDGVADDTEAIQKSIVFCGNNKRLLYIPSGVYYSIDIGDLYISTSGNIYISTKKNSNEDWVPIGSKSV